MIFTGVHACVSLYCPPEATTSPVNLLPNSHTQINKFRGPKQRNSVKFHSHSIQSQNKLLNLFCIISLDYMSKILPVSIVNCRITPEKILFNPPDSLGHCTIWKIEAITNKLSTKCFLFKNFKDYNENLK